MEDQDAVLPDGDWGYVCSRASLAGLVPCERTDGRAKATRAPIPAWCSNPLLRGFVMGTAMSAPLMVIIFAIFGHR